MVIQILEDRIQTHHIGVKKAAQDHCFDLMFKKIHFKEKEDEFIPKLQRADKSFIFLYLKNMKFSIWIKNLFFQSFYSAIVAEMPCFYMARAQNW